MSQSPLEAKQLKVEGEYADAFRQLGALLRSGRSFSGHERNCVYLNTGGARFADASVTSGLDFDDDARGLACVDWDFDGDVDLWLTNRSGPRLRFMRNNAQSANHFVAIKLAGNGTTCNRDAVGARVSVHLQGRAGAPLMRTLRAGEGFVSQSSKWLHFGLGAHDKIDRVHVRFPDGHEQTHVVLEADAFHLIEQGRAEAQRWTPPKQAVQLGPSPIEPLPATQKARVRLSSAAPLPPLRFTDFDGKPYVLEPPLKSMVLVNLWATWCKPCHAELEQLKAGADRLRAYGVEVLALSVDSVDESHSTTADDALAYLDEMAFPFPGAVTDARGVAVLQAYQNGHFQRTIELSLPTSFLFRQNGQAMAIYRGPLEVDQLIADAGDANLSPDKMRSRAVPGAGRWLLPPGVLDELHVVRALYAAGLEDVAKTYAAQHGVNVKIDDEATPFIMH